jgi:hypothetical protein
VAFNPDITTHEQKPVDSSSAIGDLGDLQTAARKNQAAIDMTLEGDQRGPSKSTGSGFIIQTTILEIGGNQGPSSCTAECTECCGPHSKGSC